MFLVDQRRLIRNLCLTHSCMWAGAVPGLYPHTDGLVSAEAPGGHWERSQSVPVSDLAASAAHWWSYWGRQWLLCRGTAPQRAARQRRVHGLRVTTARMNGKDVKDANMTLTNDCAHAKVCVCVREIIWIVMEKQRLNERDNWCKYNGLKSNGIKSFTDAHKDPLSLLHINNLSHARAHIIGYDWSRANSHLSLPW